MTRILFSLVATAAVAVANAPAVAVASEEASDRASIFGAYGFFWLLGLAGAGLALYKAWEFFQWMEAQSPGTPRMVEIAGYVRTGAEIGRASCRERV